MIHSAHVLVSKTVFAILVQMIQATLSKRKEFQVNWQTLATEISVLVTRMSLQKVTLLKIK